jgi:hypothetical protein
LSVYDFRFAPFTALDEAAKARSLFTGPASPDVRIRTGIPVFPRCIRHELATA